MAVEARADRDGGSDLDAALRAEAIRIEFADAWGAMGASWGVAPAIARVHAYLMARGEPLTEREVREALGLSHRAASLALDAAVGWGVVEKVPEPRRVGRRGPAGTAYVAVGDHFRWFSRVIAHRKALEGDPIVAVLERRSATPTPPPASIRTTPSSAGCATGSGHSSASFGCSTGPIGLVPVVEPPELERILALLAKVPDETLLRLVRLLGELPDDDVLSLVNGLSRLSPDGARRATKLMSGVVRTVAR